MHIRIRPGSGSASHPLSGLCSATTFSASSRQTAHERTDEGAASTPSHRKRIIVNTTLSSRTADVTVHSQPSSVVLPDAAQLRALSLAHRLSLRLAVWLLVRAAREERTAERLRELALSEQRRRALLEEYQATALYYSVPLQLR